MSDLDKFQQHAVEVKGTNILVSAGAGAGKTTVLKERLFERILNGDSLKNYIVLTFTKDAAANMKEKIRLKLKEYIKNTPNSNNIKHIKNELLSLDSYNIETFDSFTLSICKEYYYLLNIKPDINILDDVLNDILLEEVMDYVFNNLIIEEDPQMLSLLSLTNDYDQDSLKYIFRYLMDKYDLIIDYKDNYFIDQLTNDLFNKLIEKNTYEINTHIANYERLLDNNFTDEKVYEKFEDFKRTIIEFIGLKVNDNYDNVPRSYGKQNGNIFGNSKTIDPDEKEEFKELRRKIKEEINEVISLTQLTVKEQKEYFSEMKSKISDMEYVFSKILEEFEIFKKHFNSYTYMDISKMCLKLFKENPIVLNNIKYSTKEILVDEYQDTSDVQEEIINILSNNNLYMVGDIKQSIYGFRNANPLNFQKHYLDYEKNIGGTLVTLQNNYRSRREVVEDINKLFSSFMNKSYGGIDYDKNQILYPGNKYYLDTPINHHMSVLEYKKDDYPKTYNTAEIEATIIKDDILSKIGTMDVYDEKEKCLRKATYKDFCVLSETKGKFDILEGILTNSGILCKSSKDTSFIHSEEIFFVHNLYELCYLMYQEEDIDDEKYNNYVISILRSFIINKTDDEIHDMFYNKKSLKESFNDIYNNIYEISLMFNSKTIYDILNEIYNRFNIYESLVKIGNVKEREYKLQYLLEKSIEFNTYGLEMFSRFLTYLYDYEREIEYEKPDNDADAVELMTIHKSKGLEFKIVYLFDINHSFNKSDIRNNLIYSKEYGLFYKLDDNSKETVMYKYINNDYNNELISEKIRLLYVALTRCQEKLIILNPIKSKDDKKDINKCNSLKDIFYQNKDFFRSNSIDINCSNTLNKEYKNKLKYNNISNNNEFIKEYGIINQEIVNNEYVRPSRSTNKVLDINTLRAMNIGNKFHSTLEHIDISKKYVGYLDTYTEHNIIKKFIESDLIKNLDIINEYHEYSFYDEFGNEGIIDLILETKDLFYIIDYKTSDIDEDEYISQLNKYRDFLRLKTNKEIKCILYSLYKGEYKEI